MSKKLVLAVFLLVASSFFWSGNFFSGKVAYLSDLTPFKLSFFRWLLALIILLPFTYSQILKDFNYYQNNFILMIIIAILGVTIFNSFTYISLQTTMVINSTLMASVAPVMMIGFSWLIFRTKTTKFQFAGIILSLLGALSIILKGNLNNLYNLYFTTGDLWMLAAVISWCLYSVLLRKIDNNTSQLANLEVMIIIGVIFIFPFYILESNNTSYLPATGLDLVMLRFLPA